MNIKLLRKVKNHILKEPKRLYMSWWIITKKHDHDKIGFRKKWKFGLRPFAKCNTAACISGWTCLISDPSFSPSFELGANLLQLTNEQAGRLFYPEQWPIKFKAGAIDDGKKKTAEIAAKRIEHFIKTDGRE